MSEPDIRTMFASQTDAEREDVGAWFMAQLQDMMKTLLDIQVRKREISMKFEDEVGRRLAVVERKDSEVERELQGLKRGGSELIGARGKGSRGGSVGSDV